jgi:transposase
MEKKSKGQVLDKNIKKKNKKKTNKVLINTTNISPLCFQENEIFMFDCKFPNKILCKIPNLNSLKLNDMENNHIKSILKFQNNQNNIDDNKVFIQILPELKQRIEKFNKIKLHTNPLYVIIERLIKEHSKTGHISLLKLRDLIKIECGKNISKSTLWRIMRNKLGYCYRKTNIKNIVVNSLKNIISTYLYIKVLTNAILQKLYVVFIDESGFKIQNNNFRNWIKKGINLNVNSGERGKVNLIMGISSDRVVHYELNRINTDRNVFLSFINNLYEKLNDEERNKLLLIIDNATFHRTEENIKNFISKKIRILYTSPYKSELNPIEYVFRHIKNYTYKKIFNNFEELEDFIKDIINFRINPNNLDLMIQTALKEFLYFNSKNNDKNLNLKI